MERDTTAIYLRYGPDDLAGQDWKDEILEPVKRLELTRNSATPNMHEAYWVWHFITTTLHTVRPKDPEEQRRR